MSGFAAVFRLRGAVMRFDVATFSALPATHVVSLGHRCATAANVRRFFGFGEAFPFDWWITPHESLLAVLRSPVVDVVYDGLEVCLDGQSVRNRLGILLHHEFPRAADYSIAPFWQEHTEAPKSRTAYLLQKFLALDDHANHVLFVREVENASQDDEIADALAPLFTRASWALATLPHVYIAPGPAWRGDPAAWDLALSAFGITLNRGSLKPYTEVEPELDAKKL